MYKTCRIEPHHIHKFLDDWKFGGPNEDDPRYDSRWIPSVYEYIDFTYQCIYITSAPICDDQAIDEFSKVAALGAQFNPIWLQVKYPGKLKFSLLPWRYDKLTDTVYPLPMD